MLVSTDEVARHLNDSTWVVFDCRHDLMDASKGARLYGEGHLPGAHFAAVDTTLSGPTDGTNGRHPLPEPERFVTFLARHGVGAASKIVAYDDVGGQYAARLWWMARWVGLTNVAVLDGGWGKWTAERLPVTTEVPDRVRAELAGRAEPALAWGAEEVRQHLGDAAYLVVDARAPERFRGEVEPIDPVAGHIPGAKNRFFKMNLRADLTMRPAEELKREFKALLGSVRPENVVHQCGSGITACANLLAMEHAGLHGSKLYGGSWSKWIADPARPVAKGAEGQG